MKHLYLSVLGIGLAATTAFAQYNATITVTDLVTGLPLQDAEVIFDGNFQTTDAAGMVVFTDLIDFDYSYTVSKGCYTAYSGMLTIAGGDNSDAIALEPTTSNAVFFFIGSPLTIPGATVTLTDNANYFETLVTGAPFGDLFENVPFGEYSYSISIPCYEPLSGNVTVNCPENGDGIALFLEPVELTSNAVFFFVGSPLTIPGATVTLTDNANYFETLVTGAPFGDAFENVPFGEYSYSISIPCYEPLSGSVTVNCPENGDGIALFLEPVELTSNAVFFFVGSPLTIPGATVTLTDNANYLETLVTGAPFGDAFENVPFGEYSYSVSIPCYEPLSGTVTVDCPESGDGIALFLEPVEIVIDASVTLSANTIVATAMDMEYQWLDCNNNNEPIAGATEQSFSPPVSGLYAVIVSDGDCSQTSECTAVIVSGVEDDRTNQQAYTVYPNPFNENLLVQSNGQAGSVHVELMNMAGQVLINETRTGMELTTLATGHLAPGSYVVRLTSENESTTLSVIK
ncbi:MAG: T9SS type A sorting domain-containing protein [Flavobacteriales bacterium]|nr:T9SS type A sorting domain-containing protein [Flavobacteriales bacterium]